MGTAYEKLAGAYLEQQGYEILEYNYRCRMGEIDIVARQGGYLVFVEVKLRKDDTFAAAREFVDQRKQERIRKTALFYLQSHSTQLQPRFDVVEIYAPNGPKTDKPEICHWEDAFQ